ncbi:glycosyltransferase family 2 protein [Vibrio splendidus]|uniref:glycosyltransferase family 2 protein n=1 Tax=Vibrio splendidus TaxID=29497 RepID=UPI000D37F0DF|nr:glycosyltransferase family 2 protein [Vibrio splendidus]PTO58141.1 glycosyltransferase family 2 protein [Vibrio splendidus]PTQ04560.1 glycosyltransferase family 2 protein [Vibrio splendidus]
MNKKISVIIPMYNAESVIIRAVQSVLNQTIDIDEIIIVDDGSKDDSFDVISKFAIDNSSANIRVEKKLNGGASSARNFGILHARNEILAFLDSDDEWVSNKLENQIDYIVRDDVVLVGGNHFDKIIQYISLKKAKGVNEITLRDLLFKNYFQTSTVMTKKSIALNFDCFNENQKYAEEGQFYYNLSKYGKMIHINKKLVIYDGGEKSGFGESGLSANIKEMEKGELSNLKYAYSNLDISLITYLAASLFSVLKFVRRFYLVKIKK